MRFKERIHLHKRRVKGKAASSELEIAARCREYLIKIINEGGYTKQAIFSVDGIAFSLKTPSRIFIARDEKSVSAFKTSKDSLTYVRNQQCW